MATVRKALTWSFIERYSSLVVTMLGSMVLARLLAPREVGIYSLCATITTVATVLRDFGISEYLIQERELTRDKIKAAYGLAILMAWSIGAVLFSVRHLAANFYNEQGLVSVISVLCLNFVVLPFASPTYALLSREMQFRKVFVLQFSSTVVQNATGIYLAWTGHSYLSLAWSSIAGVTTQTILLTIMRPADSFLMPSLKAAPQVLRFGSMFVTSRAIETLTRNSHEFILAKQFGFGAVGLFSRAFGLIELFYTNVATAILRVATPAFAAEHRAGNSLADSFARGTAIFTALAWPFFGFVALMASPIIHLLFGSNWLGAAPIARMLALASIPAYLCVLAPNLLSATGQIHLRLRVTALILPCHLAMIFFTSRISMTAVAMGWGFTNTLSAFLYMAQVRKVLKARTRDLLGPASGSAVLALISVAAQVAASQLATKLALHDLLSLLLVAAVGGTAWLLAVYGLPTDAGREIRQTIGVLSSSVFKRLRKSA